MTIRYACEKCGSVLKIKEDRIGKEGHCPKCKKAFIVPAEDTVPSAPAKESAAPDKPSTPDKKPSATAKKTATPEADAVSSKPPEPVATAEASPDDAEFDPVAFLMTDGPKTPKAPAGKSEAAAPAGEAPDMRAKRNKGPNKSSEEYAASDEPDVRVGAPRNVAVADEDTEAKLRNRKLKRAGAPPSASKSADEMLRVNAAASSAKDLMAKTVEESRIRAAQMPQDRTKPSVDYAGTVKELLVRFAPAVGGTLLVIVLAFLFSNMMFGPAVPLPDLAEVSGTVTKAGEPLVDARVSYQPIDTKAGASSAYTDENGYYEMKYIEGVNGVVLGKCKVEVSLIGPDGREIVKPQTPYGLGSNEIHTVEEGSQTINIEIP